MLQPQTVKTLSHVRVEPVIARRVLGTYAG